MKLINLLKNPPISIDPQPVPKVEGPALSDTEVWIFLIVTLLMTVFAVCTAIYFARCIKKQNAKSKNMLIANLRDDYKILITPDEAARQKRADSE